MRIALFTTFRTDRREPLATTIDRVSDAFMAAGLDPSLGFVFTDSPLPGFVSAVDRAAKRLPKLAPFVIDAPALPGGPAVHQLRSHPDGHAITLSTLREVASGIPRSFPFNTALFAFGHEEFGPPLGDPNVTPRPGVQVRDDWWVNGRMRSLTALTVIDVEASHEGPLPVPQAVQAIIAACGEVEGTNQVAMPEIPPPGTSPLAPGTGPQNPVAATVLRYREGLSEVVERAGLPHELPPLRDALANHLGVKSGSHKPALARAFKPLGYDITSKSGTFTLRRRTEGNHVVEISIDVGTWSHMVSASFAVRAPDFNARLPLPVGPGLDAPQYPIGDAEQWQQIVENLAAFVAELDRTFVPEIEEAAGPAPDWFDPRP